jgi:hypothetical protein
MKYILGLLCSMNLLLASCQFKPFVEGVKEDTRRNFTDKKDYIYRISIESVLEKKILCTGCDINMYTLQLRLNHISEKPDISKMQYPPYYVFKGDSLLIISVGKDLFEIVNEKDKVAKEAKDLEISVNSLNHIYLSKEMNKWLP